MSEDSNKRSRRSLLANSLNHTTITLELGDPPAQNITVAPPPSVADEIRMAGGNISIDLDQEVSHVPFHAAKFIARRCKLSQEGFIPEITLNGSNLFDADRPDSVEDFVNRYNESATYFLEEIAAYEEAVHEVEEINSLGEQLINMVHMCAL